MGASNLRQVLDCASPLALRIGTNGRSAARKRQRAAAVQDASAHCHAPSLAPALMSSTLPTPPSGGGSLAPLPPPRVPDHELLRRIGRGAYGEVWLARCVIGAYRAVKIVHRRSFDHDRPFEREFEGILKFEPVSRTHDSQVDILHVGRGEDCFYYVMELADDQATGGQINPDNYAPRTLKSDLLFRSRLPFEECVRIGIALATALEHLHAKGLVHRDVKPSNIIFVNGVPKLADIGLVTGVDATRSYVGTEGFSAPEGTGTPQADIYSLGKVLYEIATGKDRQEFPDLPTQLRELPDREGLMELNAVIARACRHDPKDRYASAAVMRADLELLQSGKSLARLHRTEARLRFVQRAGAIVTALAALIAAGWLWQARQTHLVRELADEKSRLIEEKGKLAEENREQLVRLRVANGIRILDAGDPATALLWLTDALPLVTNRPAAEAIHRIRVQQVLTTMPWPKVLAGYPNVVIASAWSPDGRHIALSTCSKEKNGPKPQIDVRDTSTGDVIWTRLIDGTEFLSQVRFTRDGSALLASTSFTQGLASEGQPSRNLALVLSAESGREIYPPFTSSLAFSTFSPDDRWLALAGTNHVIRIINAMDGTPVVELKGHTNKIQMLSFSADGTLLASASSDRTARLWRLPSGTLLGTPLVHEDLVQRVVLSDDGRRMLTTTITSGTNQEWLAQLWDVQTGRKVGHPMHDATALAFSLGSGDRFLLTTDRAEIEVRDSRTLEMVYAPIKMHSSIRSWDFSADGRRCVIGSQDGTAYVWNFENREGLSSLFQQNSWVESVHFSPDGRRLLATCEHGTAKVWLLGQHAETARLSLPASHLHTPAENQRPRGLSLGLIPVELADQAPHLIDAEQLTEVRVLRPQQTNAVFAGWVAGPGGHRWAIIERLEGATPRDILALWSREGQGWRQFDLPHPALVMQAAFNADESKLTTVCRDGNARIWRTSDGSLERTVPLPGTITASDSSVVNGSALRPDGGAILAPVMDDHGQLTQWQLFDLASGQFAGKPFPASYLRLSNKIAFSPDGTRLGSVGEDQCGTIIDLLTGKLTGPSFKHGGSLFDLDWSPDGKRLLTAGLHPAAKLWDGVTGERLLRSMQIGDKPTRAARWSADGRCIITRSDEKLVRVWDAATAEAVTPLLRHSGYIRWACITPGNRLITASDPDLLRAWDLKPVLLPADVLADCARVLAGNRLDASGGRWPVTAVEQEKLHRSLRSRAPQLFE